MKANEYQVGGTHYKTPYEHWDLVLDVGMGYLEGCSTAYVVRWREKGKPAEDLKKALHFLNKLEEDGTPPLRLADFADISAKVAKFNEVNQLLNIESAYIATLSTWETWEDLSKARQLLFALLDEAEKTGPTPAPLTEENHHAERSTDGW